MSLEPTLEGDFTFAADEPFRLESGSALQPVTLHYAVYGKLREGATWSATRSRVRRAWPIGGRGCSGRGVRSIPIATA